MEYNFGEIEQNARKFWQENEVYKVSNNSDKPKFYVLDMFPYPSGAGLHVGHPLGYIASDIYARYKRLKGFNVLHPMGYDAFGLPAEQYALETGQHPAVTTEQNIKRYRQQLDNIGFCYDWSREVRTSDPNYYKWTQWIFLQLFHSWFDRAQQKARPISELTAIFEQEGNANHTSPTDEQLSFSAEEWKAMDKAEQRNILMGYRLAYLSHAEVWWCEALGTVLANDEVQNGVSERGGHPVVKKRMNQWFLRITEYAERLSADLNKLDWTDAMKEMQRNWIGKSEGAEVEFYLSPNPSPEEKGTNKPNWNTAEPSLYGALIDKRKELKDSPTSAEYVLWQALRNKQLGVKFRRQHIIGRYIPDFVCIPKKLIIEVDGAIHDTQKEADEERTRYLNEKGYTVIRFTNEEVLSDLNNVVAKISSQLEALSAGEGLGEVPIKVFTTRPDTIYGVDFMVLAPEHELVDEITTAEQKAEVEKYKEYVQSRSERERMTEVKSITGAFTGAYVTHPFTQKQVPVWISEYVLAGYGTGAIMAVPAGDERDHAFAKHFGIDITNIYGDLYNGEEAYTEKKGTIENSDFLSGVAMPESISIAIKAIEEKGLGTAKVNYKLRDAGFSRQRYWGEPFPIVYIDGQPYATDEQEAANAGATLPVELPHVESYKPGPEGQGPLANETDWVNTPVGKRETNTMPGYAGSSWYFLRYMDPHNDETFADRKATDYWQAVDVYIGGTEHAVGHLLYSRMWTKALHDLGHIGFDEPFKKLINQGMIQGNSRFVYRINGTKIFIPKPMVDKLRKGDTEDMYQVMSYIDDQFDYKVFDQKGSLTWEALKKVFINKENLQNDKDYNIYDISQIHVDISLVDGLELDVNKFKSSRQEYNDANFILLDDKYICGAEIEKMSKSKYNVVNPDLIVAQYGADTFRMYEMFLGPIEVSKPWDTKGIEGVHRFLKKLWRLYFDEQKGWIVTDEEATKDELKSLHKTIKKTNEDIERFSFNTSVSQFMICVNELTAMNCHKRAILEPLAILIAPFAPHLAEALWSKLGHSDSVTEASYPEADEQYLVENSKKYPVAINGKTRAEMEFPLDIDKAELEKQVLANETVMKWMEGKSLRKFIYVPGRMINVVIG